ncbi:MAG TPA: MBL fold metallo-hydrolase [Myxococcales bacterium]|nr:MBL fold metallo-hydrolase [Myxococcales bacterium]
MRILVLFLLAATSALAQQQDFSKVEIKATKVAGNVWVLTGAGGNIGATVGEEGVAIVDDQFAPLSPKIHAALQKLSPRPVRFVINTHWHGDHTGGNAGFADTATILAQANVRKRLQAGGRIMDREIPPAPAAALPIVTFEQGLSLWWNGEEIRAIHPGRGHTDGDSVIWFTRSNVVHMGDDYFSGMFPFVDLESGGSVVKLIESLDVILGQIPADARIIPGHGPVSGVAELRKYRAMLAETVDAVRKGLASGKSVEQLRKENVLAPWASWGNGFVKADMFIGTIAQDLASK